MTAAPVIVAGQQVLLQQNATVTPLIFMFVVEAMLRCVTFRLSSRDVSFPVFSVSRPNARK